MYTHVFDSTQDCVLYAEGTNLNKTSIRNRCVSGACQSACWSTACNGASSTFAAAASASVDAAGASASAAAAATASADSGFWPLPWKFTQHERSQAPCSKSKSKSLYSLEEIHLLDNEDTTDSPTHYKNYDRVYVVDGMLIIYPRNQILTTSNRFDPLDDRKNLKNSSLSMDSKSMEYEECRKHYSSNNLVDGYHNQIPRTLSGCINKNVYAPDYPLCFNKPPHI